MRALLQRVRKARVEVGGETVGAISSGLLIFVGVTHSDTPETAKWLAEKSVRLRIFEHPERSGQHSLLDLGLEVLAVSQFTLYSNTNKGRRPGYDEAAPPEVAEPLFNHFVQVLRNLGVSTATGRFGAEMQVHLVNNGPVTHWLER